MLINSILAKFISQSPEIQAVVLVSSEGQPLAEPIGIDNNSALVMAGAFLLLSQEIYQEFYEPEIKNITIQGQDGYLLFYPCYQETFLLVKASKSLSVGFLERNIRLMKEKLQTELQMSEPTTFKTQTSFDAALRDSFAFKYNEAKIEKNHNEQILTSKESSKKRNLINIVPKNQSIRYRGLPGIK